MTYTKEDLERAQRWLHEVWSEDERDLAALIACVRREERERAAKIALSFVYSASADYVAQRIRSGE